MLLNNTFHLNSSVIKISLDKVALLIWLLVTFYFTIHFSLWRDESNVIKNDVISYYAYLPATFVHKDIDLSYWEDLEPNLQNKLFYELLDDGSRLIKTSMGVSMFYAPFFIPAHQYAILSPDHLANGYSLPYRLAIQLSTIVFLFFGLNYLRKFLLAYFSSGTVFLTLITVSLGTNLMNYTVFEAGMSHPYCFFLLSALLFYFDAWLKNEKPANIYKFGFLFGWLVLSRPINGLFLLFFIAWGLSHFGNLKASGNWLHKKSKAVFKAVLIALLVVSPQLIYWKLFSGEWFFNSYRNEPFFFADPKILEGLFSYRKGWLVYTPIMIFSILGWFIPQNKKLKSRIPSILIFLIYIYFLFSWWTWWYGGSFGMRTMIDLYPILAISIAMFFHWLFKRKLIFSTALIAICGFLIYLNFFQQYQYREKLIHYDSMNKKTYWGVFLKKDYPENYWEDLSHPNYGAAKQGERDL